MVALGAAFAISLRAKRAGAVLELARDMHCLSAEGAIEALLRSSPSQEVVESLQQMVASNPRLKRVFVEQQNETR